MNPKLIEELIESHFNRLQQKFFRGAKEGELRDVSIYPYKPWFFDEEGRMDLKLYKAIHEVDFIWEYTDAGYFSVPMTADFLAKLLKCSKRTVQRHLEEVIKQGIVLPKKIQFGGKTEIIYEVNYPLILGISQKSINLITEFCWKYGNPQLKSWKEDLTEGKNTFPAEEYWNLIKQIEEIEKVKKEF